MHPRDPGVQHEQDPAQRFPGRAGAYDRDRQIGTTNASDEAAPRDCFGQAERDQDTATPTLRIEHRVLGYAF